MAGTAQIWTVMDVAKYMRVHTSTIYRMVERRRIPAFRVGADWRFHREHLERWMQAQYKTEQNGGR